METANGKWWSRIKALFSPKKWPGWALFLWSLFTQAPTWRSRIVFWSEAFQKVSDHAALIGEIVASRLFGVGLLILSVSYLLFVGEPRRTIRHPLVPVLGWVVVGVVALMFWLVMVAGYVAVHFPAQLDTDSTNKIKDLARSNQQLGSELARLREQQRPRQIVKKEEFIQALRAAGPSTLHLAYVDGDRDASDLFADLNNLLITGGWVIQNRSALHATPWKGVRIVVKDWNAIPPGALLLVGLLRQNGIAAGIMEHAENVTLTTATFSVEIGYRP